MIVRAYRPEDAAAIDEIYERCGHTHNRPDLRNVIGSVVIEYDGVIVAYGALETIAEASIILDTEVSHRVKVEALKEMFDTALLCARLSGYKVIYAFTENDRYSKTLQRHFDFEPAELLLKREV